MAGLTAGALLLRDACCDAALLLLVAATAMDGLDGIIARRWRQQSELGALLDPIADKAVMSVVYGAMALHSRSPALWVLFLLGAARDAAVTGRRIHAYRVTGKALAPDRVGKLKTVVQSVGAPVVLYQSCRFGREFSLSSWPATALFAIVVALSFASWGRYAALAQGRGAAGSPEGEGETLAERA